MEYSPTLSSENFRSPKPGRAWYAVFIFMVALGLSQIDRMIITLMVEPIQRDLRLSDTQFGLLIGLAFTITYSVAGIPIARLADRGYRRTIIAVSVFVWSMMTACCGLAQSYWQLFLARMGVGVGEASLTPVVGSILADIFPRDKRNKAFAVFAMGGSIGIGVAYLGGSAIMTVIAEYEKVTLPLVGAIASWKVVFILLAIPGLLLTALIYTTPRLPPRGKTADGGQLSGIVVHFKEHAKANALWIGGFALTQVVFLGFLGWLPALLLRRFDVEVDVSGLTLGVIAIVCGPLGLFAGGALADHLTVKGRWDSQVRVAILGTAGLGIAAVLMPLSTGWILAMALLSLLYFSACVASGVGLSAIQALTPPHLRAQATAVFQLTTIFVGSAGGPLSVALLTDYVFRDPMAIHWSMAIVGGSFAIIAIVVLWIGLRPFGKSAYQVYAQNSSILS